MSPQRTTRKQKKVNVDINVTFEPPVKKQPEIVLSLTQTRNQQIGDFESRLTRFLDFISKVISILSGIAVIIFVILLIVGYTSLGDVKITNLLTIFSFTLVGGLISIGGVKIFSINASLRRTKERIERITNTGESICPFIPLYSGNRNETIRPGNPHVCYKCPLGVDLSSGSPGGLIHFCKAYPKLNSNWVKLTQ